MMDDNTYYDYEDDNVDIAFPDYEETTVDPGHWLLTATVIVSIFLSCCVLPSLVRYANNRRKQRCEDVAGATTQVSTAKITTGGAEHSSPHAYFSMTDNVGTAAAEDDYITAKKVVQLDKESKKILKYAVPFTTSNVSKALFSNAILALVAHNVGAKAAAAYAIVIILFNVADEFMRGPLLANTTLLSHAIGVGNNYLAGQYFQASLCVYLLATIPVVCLWILYIDNIVFYLEGGDEDVAQFALDLSRWYVFATISKGLRSSLSGLLKVTDHEIFVTIVDILESAIFVLIMSIVTSTTTVQLHNFAQIELAVTASFLLFTITTAQLEGWLKPFVGGMFGRLAIKDTTLVKNLLKTSIPLSFGALLSDAEWTVLTIFASHLGQAEVAAWAILGNWWKTFEAIMEGMGDATEIRVAYHLGGGHPKLAKLAAFKSLFLATSASTLVSCIFFSVRNQLPKLFTTDPTLQDMLHELVPFVGVGNIAMAFGMSCWHLVGAQGKFRLGTRIAFLSSWGLMTPTAAVFVYALNINLQGLAAARVIEYTFMGGVLSYILFSSDWENISKEIQRRNATEGASGDLPESFKQFYESDMGQEILYAALASRHSKAAEATARLNLLIFIVPPGELGLVFEEGNSADTANVILEVKDSSPLYGKVTPGDHLVAIDGADVSKLSTRDVYDVAQHNLDREREVTICTNMHHNHDGASGLLLEHITAPPGKLGIDFVDDPTNMVEKVCSSSPLYGRISPGDFIVTIDGVHVSDHSAQEIRDIVYRDSKREREVTFISASNHDGTSQSSPIFPSEKEIEMRTLI